MNRSDYWVLILILATRLNGAIGLVPKRKLFERVNAGNGLVQQAFRR